ncbi:hypothetical protein CVT24_005974, partial [Panaeolus cyanescens]
STLTPLIFSVIFYLSNGRYKVAYIDALFNCVSAMAVCGLATINLSELTPFQQAILFFLMSIGSPITVSWITVFLRRHYFRKKFEHLVLSSNLRPSHSMVPHIPKKSFISRLKDNFTSTRVSIHDEESTEVEVPKKKYLRTDMIRRMDHAPQRVDPNGWLSQGASEQTPSTTAQEPVTPPVLDAHETPKAAGSDQATRPAQLTDLTEAHFTKPKPRRRTSDPGIHSRPPTPPRAPMHRSTTLAKTFTRTPTVEFAHNLRRPSRAADSNLPGLKEKEDSPHQPDLYTEQNGSVRNRRGSTAGSFRTHPSMTFNPNFPQGKPKARERGFGGFPAPWTMLMLVISRLFPTVRERFSRTMTIPVTTSLVPGHVTRSPDEKAAPYLSFGTTVGRNSAFHRLTKDQLAEVGGVEYRALNALLCLVAVYHFGFQLIGFTIIGAYTAQPRWASVFSSENQVRPVNSVWFSAYQVVSAYTNTGTSLVDQSMLPFQRAYPVIVTMAILILAGNTCFPIFMRFFIWILTKCVSKTSLLQETLTFLLHHPRRCFIYLFPSHQTWFLLSIVILLTLIDWVGFLVLDINNHVIEMIPVGIRVLAGFMQGVSVRAAGFGIIPLAAMAPAVKVMYVVMMYISVYPIAMSVRSTNVYEEQSLGIYDQKDEDEESKFNPEGGPRLKVWSQYLAIHARKQLAFDMWWIALSLFLICCKEAARIDDPANATWFNIFTILFELVSAYGTVGLSLGIPDQNYSLSGAFSTFSKLVVCIVMLRGRHRGLPFSIDRAIMFPSEYSTAEEAIRERKSLHSGDGDGQNLETREHEPFVYSETMTSARISIHQRFPQNSRLRRLSTHDDLFSVAERGDTSSDEGRFHRNNSDDNDNLKEY